MKTVLDVGNCNPDHGAIRAMIERCFDAQVRRAHGLEDTLAALRNEPIDLVLVNRILDRDGSEGIELIKRIKADPQLASTPVMLLTNYAEHQDRAVEAGAERGFGKGALDDAQTLERLSRFLGPARG